MNERTRYYRNSSAEMKLKFSRKGKKQSPAICVNLDMSESLPPL
jgi:hypothetical protein